MVWWSEKVKVMREKMTEVYQGGEEAFEDGVVMGWSEKELGE
ncbi:hypothetical protein [Neisseria sicca]